MKKKELLDKYKYLIIGGTTKAATTSLFHYLADHPEVCASSMKETRFFLDKEYPLSSKYRFTDGIEKYNEFFNHCDNSKLRLEATPDYLYSMGTPERIFKSLPKAKILFILREPVSRLISWYNFAKQNGSIPEEISLGEYVKEQLVSDDAHKTQRGQHVLALEQGRYYAHLKPFFEIFNRGSVLVIFFEQLSENPLAVLKEVCSFAGIDQQFYDHYTFKIFNPTENMRNSKIHFLYKYIKYSVRTYTHNKPLIHSALKKLRLKFEPLYTSLNTYSTNAISIPHSLEKFLNTYYNEQAHLLRELTGRTVPWKRYL